MTEELKDVGQFWGQVRKHTLVYLPKDMEFGTFGGTIVLKAGWYRIAGFWADAMGLNAPERPVKHLPADYFIIARALSQFQVKSRVKFKGVPA